jgi:glycosyltransferase involved in cell wall biosynthesis
VAAFLCFAISSFLKGLIVRRVDVVWGTSPPIFQAASALLLAVVKRVPFVLEVRDLWPEFAIDMGVLQNPVLIMWARRLERLLYSKASRIVVNSPAFRTYLIKHGVPDDKMVLIPNGVETGMFNPGSDGKGFRKHYELPLDTVVVMYTGALGMANDIGTILQAAEHLRSRPDIIFVIIGDGKDRFHLERAARSRGLSNVRFLGAIPKSEVPHALAAADICLATLLPIPMFTTTYPNKVFDYMAAGRPVVLAIDGVIREVVEQAEGGLFVRPGDGEALAMAVSRLASDPILRARMGESARIFVEAHFQRKEQADRLANVLAEVTGG